MNYFLLHTNYPILFLSIFARQLWIPVPAILFLISGGALIGTGKLTFSAVMLAVLAGSLLGDLVWFEAGRLGGKRVLSLLSTLTPNPSYFIRHSKTTFADRGLFVLLVAKFVPGLDGIAPPLAGMSRASLGRFLFYDACGSAFWAGTYISVGFIFAAELNKMGLYLSSFANTLILTLGAPLLCVLMWKLWQLMQMIRLLRPLKITPEQLKTRLDSGEKIGVIDLLRFEDDPQDSHVITGAWRVDPREMRRKRRIVTPLNLDLVLYCDSKNTFVSARVAVMLRKRGVRRIRVLEGGLSAWRNLGFPMSITHADPLAEMERLGIKMDPPLRGRRAKVALTPGQSQNEES